MKKNRLLTVFLLLAVMMVSVLPVTVSANSAAPPNLTIIVLGAPDDMTLTLEGLGDDMEIVHIGEDRRLWENCYRIYLSNWNFDVSGYELVVSGGGTTFSCQVPEDVGTRYEDLVTVDFAAQTLTVGQPQWRQPLLVFLRVALTLLIEGVVFYLFGYRKALSWVVFVIVNLLTQTWLNSAVAEPAFNQQYWEILFVLIEAVIFAAEAIVFPLLIDEKKKSRAVLCALVANAASLLLGGWLLSVLPV